MSGYCLFLSCNWCWYSIFGCQSHIKSITNSFWNCKYARFAVFFSYSKKCIHCCKINDLNLYCPSQFQVLIQWYGSNIFPCLGWNIYFSCLIIGTINSVDAWKLHHHLLLFFCRMNLLFLCNPLNESRIVQNTWTGMVSHTNILKRSIILVSSLRISIFSVTFSALACFLFFTLSENSMSQCTKICSFNTSVEDLLAVGISYSYLDMYRFSIWNNSNDCWVSGWNEWYVLPELIIICFVADI